MSFVNLKKNIKLNTNRYFDIHFKLKKDTLRNKRELNVSVILSNIKQ